MASATHRRPWFLIGVVVASFLFRAIVAARVGILPEEAYYWNYAQHPSLGYYDHPPAVAWMIIASTQLLGHNNFALRLGPLLCGIVASVFLFRLASDRWNNSKAGWRTVALFNILPVFFGATFFSFPDAPLIATWSAAIFFGYRATRDEKLLDWVFWGTAAGFALLSKYYAGALLVAAFFFAITSPEGRVLFRKPGIYLGVAIALLIFSPVVWWNSEHEWVSFRFQFFQRSQGSHHFRLPEFVAFQLGAVTPICCLLCWFLAISALRSGDGRDRWLSWQCWSILFPFAVYSLMKSVHINWTGVGYLSLLPLAQRFLSAESTALPSPGRWRVPLQWSLALSACVILWLLLYLCHPAFPIWMPERGAQKLAQRFSWTSFAAAAERVEHEIEKERGAEPFFLAADKYYLASIVAYMDDDQDWWDATSRNLLNQQALAWGMWTHTKNFDGRDAIILAQDPNQLATDDLENFFEKLGPIQELPLQDDPLVRRQFFYRVGYRYRPSR